MVEKKGKSLGPMLKLLVATWHINRETISQPGSQRNEHDF